ncbi:Elongation factor P, C-terminal [Cynara cardunculus var. scolymus]|uniref:Elongation factor P, C-terminal n=1 Tax=Cynara cardunculus var. scolymus TaxID=59895 RepID=A0A103Y0F0_CYNCS|nr:Elongation factor P, C-terminal [Cynara cardunculus var. scolymus]
MRAVAIAAAAAAAKARRISGRLHATSSVRQYSIMISPHLKNITLTHSDSSIYSDDRSRPYGQPLAVPWSANQIRFAKARGSDVVKAQHSTQGRGGAIIQVELRDVDSGNKVNERFRTDEIVEKVFVEAKSFTYLYTDEESDSVVLMEPNTFVQLDVPKHLFGDSLAYLKDDITVSVELFNDRAMSASVPKRVTCTVVEAQVPMKGMGATPHTKKVLLDNGITVQVPPHVITGDKLLIDTTDNSYISRCGLSVFLIDPRLALLQNHNFSGYIFERYEMKY